jgi:hypothetical protein
MRGRWRPESRAPRPDLKAVRGQLRASSISWSSDGDSPQHRPAKGPAHAGAGAGTASRSPCRSSIPLMRCARRTRNCGTRTDAEGGVPQGRDEEKLVTEFLKEEKARRNVTEGFNFAPRIEPVACRHRPGTVSAVACPACCQVVPCAPSCLDRLYLSGPLASARDLPKMNSARSRRSPGVFFRYSSISPPTRPSSGAVTTPGSS